MTTGKLPAKMLDMIIHCEDEDHLNRVFALIREHIALLDNKQAYLLQVRITEIEPLIARDDEPGAAAAERDSRTTLPESRGPLWQVGYDTRDV